VFIGHFALGFGAKRLNPTVSLGTLFLACQLADLVWPSLVLAGIERVVVEPGNTAFTPLRFPFYPYSHSLTALLVWALVVGAAYRAIREAPLKPALLLAALVLSHWFLDVVTHRADMPITVHGQTKIGFGLWHSIPLTIVVESLMFAAGLALYARATRPRDRAGSIGLWSLALFLYGVNLANLLGPPPPSARAVAWTAEAMWLLVAAGYYVDRHREPR
jgi:membrane-bound metal-dependent hydrolase YbcI (DUF457 family)